MNLEDILQYKFKDPLLLRQALTHSSYAYENDAGPDNERLEFLGDAVLELAVSRALYHAYPHMAEGDLTRARARLVCEASLCAVATRLGVGMSLRLGRGEEQTGGRERPSVLSDALEAVVGAVYLDGGLEEAAALVARFFADAPLSPDAPAEDSKTVLQEIVQRVTHIPLEYQIVAEAGPPHSKTFTAEVRHMGELLGTGQGRTKKEAERQAAARALESMKR